MFVSGFTFIRNAIKFDYPIVEAITSILPLCDEFVVALGNSDDDTAALIQSIPTNKIKIVHTVWDDSLRKGGKVLAVETDKAFASIAPHADWAFYIQGDEVLHEKYLPVVAQAMQHWKDDKQVEGLLFDYLHFYGSYDYIGDSRKWYRREIRVVKNINGLHSYRDAQGFRINDRKLRVKPLEAGIYHYGWVKPPELQQAKQKYFHKLWHSDNTVAQMTQSASKFDYSQIDSLKRFTGSHPEVIKKRIENKNWHFDADPAKKNFGFKAKLLYMIENVTAYRIGEYKNYKII